MSLAAGVATVTVAAGFAAFAEAALARESRDVFAWNESFVIGAGGSAALLFPLSLLFPRRALDIVALLLAVSLVLVFPLRTIRRRRAPGGSAAPARPSRASRRTVLVLLLILALSGFFGWLCLRSTYAWDGFQIWGTKSLLLFRDGGLRAEMWPGSIHEGRSGRTVNYPALVPLFEALVARVSRRFDFLDLKAVFVVFFVSLLLSVAKAVRALSPSLPLVLATVAAIALSPMNTSRPMIGGNADLPMEACVAALVAAWLSPNPRAGRWNSAAPWLLGALLAAKSEGLILYVLAIVAAAVVFARKGSAGALRSRLAAAAAGAALLLLRVAYLRWTVIPDLTIAPINGPNLARALGRVPEVVSLCVAELTRFSTWGVFWPGFALLAAVALWGAPDRRKTVALAALLGWGAYTSLFLVTNWPVRLHVHQAYARLLSQLLPAAALAAVSGFLAAVPSRDGADQDVAREFDLRLDQTMSDAHASHPAIETSRQIRNVPG